MDFSRAADYTLLGGDAFATLKQFEPAAVAKAAQYEQVNKLLGERNSQRSIVRATGVARMSVANLIKKSAGRLSALTASASEKSAEKTLGSAGTG